MKSIFLFITALLCVVPPTLAQDKQIGMLSWLIGSWSRIGPTTQHGIEHWSLLGNRMIGYGLTMSGQDTVFLEQLKIEKRNGKLYYIADVKSNAAPTHFKITHISQNSFICENPKHDFPKKISYRLSGDTLTAIISGNGKQVSFLFSKS